jgi:RNA polymerase sigma-70 factor (ECF subfamily)
MERDCRERASWLARHLLPHERLLRARLRRMNIHGLEVDDVIQEVYARIVSQPSLEAIRYPLQYAARTAMGIVIDHIRRTRVVPINAVENLDHLEIVSPAASPEEQMEFREEVAEVASLLAQLPDRTREILVLRRIEGLSQRQVAEQLGISVKTVEKHMAQGVASLMALFGRGGKSANPSSTLRIEADANGYRTQSKGD